VTELATDTGPGLLPWPAVKSGGGNKLRSLFCLALDVIVVPFDSGWFAVLSTDA
jgi:hypothetical protein